MKRIVFVCTGNTCRSPMAELVLKSKFKQAGIKNVRVSSAGLSAVDGTKISKNSAKALKSLGIKSYSFRSKRLTAEIVKRADMIICMTAEHKRYLSGINGVYTMAEATGFTDVPDPYGGDINVYMHTLDIIERACDIITQKILQIQGDF